MRSPNNTSQIHPETSTERRLQTWPVVIALAVGVCAGAFVLSRPPNRVSVDAASATAWLPSVPRGAVDRVNALLPSPALAATDAIEVPMSAGTAVVRGPSTLAVVDGAGGRAALIDLRTLHRHDVALAEGERLAAVGDRVLRVDARAGKVDRLAADGSAVTPLLASDGPFDRWAGAGDTLWLTGTDGSVTRVNVAGGSGVTGGVFSADHHPLLAGAGTGAALLDDGAVIVLDERGRVTGRHRVALAAAPTGFQVAPDGGLAVIVAGADLVVADLGDDRPAVTRRVGAAGDHLGVVVLLGDRAFVADDTSGAIWTVATRPDVGAPSPIGVARGPTALEVFVKGSAVWVNDPNGPKALAIYDDTHWPVTKYGAAPTPSASAPQSSLPTESNPSPEPSPKPTPKPSPKPSPKPGPKPTRETFTTRPPQVPTKPAETASFDNLQSGSKVGKCKRAHGSVSIAADETLMIATRRTKPPADAYYLWYAADDDGNVGATWSADVYFGDQPGQEYAVYLLILKTSDARAFWDTHVSSDGEYASAGNLPGKAEHAQTLTKLVQTSMNTC
jgi:hypothetical protein